ncbi:hypothetical protein [Brevundimonas sp.]
MREGHVVVPVELVKFLLGEGEYDRLHFGEGKKGPGGVPQSFWWRHPLRKCLAAAPQSPAQGQVTREDVLKEVVGAMIEHAPRWDDAFGNRLDHLEKRSAVATDAILALFSRQPADTGEGWRPIETAPRDGSHFEARCGDCAPCDAYFNGTVFVHHDDDDGEIAYPLTEWRPHQEWRCPDCGAAADERHARCKAFSEASEARSLIQSDEGR